MARTKSSTQYSHFSPPRTTQQQHELDEALLNLQTTLYNCSCTANATARKDRSSCAISRCIEPLAWNIEVKSVTAQSECPFYTIFPKEIRDLVFEYALTDCLLGPGSQDEESPRTLMPKPRRFERATDIATNLLLTCRAIYLETYTLPIRLNPVRTMNSKWMAHFETAVLLPWQFANIQALDISLQQLGLEGDWLYKFLLEPVKWCPQARHQGVCVAPEFDGLERANRESHQSWGYRLISANTKEDLVLLNTALGLTRLTRSHVPPASAMRIVRARPLLHLTLRIPRESWYTWTDSPDSTDPMEQLGLDPSVGGGSKDGRPTMRRMQELAHRRRIGRHPDVIDSLNHETSGWAHIISKLPDLKSLELVLETFTQKSAQLEKVVECAKTWQFPIADTPFELIWDGKVEKASWSKELRKDVNYHTGFWYAQSTDFVVRSIRFTRKRRAV